jgi:hypothetical protein
MTSHIDLVRKCVSLESALRNLLERCDDHWGGKGYGWKEQDQARAVLEQLHGTEVHSVTDSIDVPQQTQELRSVE